MIHIVKHDTWKRLTAAADRVSSLEAELNAAHADLETARTELSAEEKCHEATANMLRTARTARDELRQALDGQQVANKTLKLKMAELISEITAAASSDRADAAAQMARILLARVPALGLPEIALDPTFASAAVPSRRSARVGKPAGYDMPWPDGATRRCFNRAGWPVYILDGDAHEHASWKCTGCKDSHQVYYRSTVTAEAQEHAAGCAIESRPADSEKNPKEAVR